MNRTAQSLRVSVLQPVSPRTLRRNGIRVVAASNAGMPARTIGVEALLLGQGHTGVERYIQNLVKALVQSSASNLRLRIFLWGRDGIDLQNADPRISFVRLPGGPRLLRILFQHFLLPFLLRGCDWTLFTGYLGSLLYPRARSVVCVYDLIALSRPDLVKRETALNYLASPRRSLH